MTRYFLAAAIAGLVTVPAFAETAMMNAQDMTCGDFMALDDSGQMNAMGAMEVAAAKAEGKMMTSDEAMKSGEGMMAGTMAACKDHDDMKAMDAMHNGM
ncbi:MAG: HdeA/HdeB family chaperone [Amaricoccus sp.]